MKFKGIIFDLDGTLIDSMEVWENVDRDFVAENGGIYTPDISDKVKTMTIYQSAEYFKNRFSLEMSCEEIIDRIEQMVSEKYHNSIPLKKGVLDALNTLSQMGIKMCVATATYNSLVNAALKRLGIYDMFEFVLTGSDIGVGKDSPDIFYKSAEKMGIDVSETIVVEDSLHCIETAKKADFFTVAVYDRLAENDKPEIEKICDAYIYEMTEIINIISDNNEV